MWQKLRAQIVTKHKTQNCGKKLDNSNCDETQKLKLWQNSKILIVTKLKTQIVTKLKNWNCYKSQKLNCDKTQKLKMWPNYKTEIVTKLKKNRF